ncbi:ribonuclease Z [Suicoccus acidiformans]|uniref:Ribonuclease Z n=1 Tax=Suicoccus acidiformans TaxID=2036206 RepID=A0A347WLF6_9LACT|nr:ribonuclease Z [Suicoccus acidiformans]AXY25913.1 ribonuclease Z [Suicoccus acidiformans]
MELLFLGTGAGVPSKGRNVSSLALKLLDELNEIWIFDCGEATQHQILKTTLKPRKVTHIFITHLHGDHIFGLPGFLSSRSFQGGDNEPLTIYGPKGIKGYVESSLRYSQTKLQYPLKIVELDSQGGSIAHQGWLIEYLPLKHGVECFGYRIIEPDKEGELLVGKLQEYNIPNGPIFGQLKRGEIVTLADGTVLDGKDFIGQPKAGRVITILGDTRPNANIDILAKDADVLVHEGTHSQDEAKMAHRYFHSTVADAAKAAERNQVKQLYINHISSRYLAADVKQLANQAKRIFPESQIVHDLQQFEVD